MASRLRSASRRAIGALASASTSLYVATTSSGDPVPRRRTWRSSSMVGTSAQCRSSSTSSSRCPLAAWSSSRTTASKSWWRSRSCSLRREAVADASAGPSSGTRLASVSAPASGSRTSSVRPGRFAAYSRSASTNGWYGVTLSSSLRPCRTTAPSSCTAVANRATRRVLPMPGSPVHTTSPPSLREASSQRACNRRSAAARPTNGACSARARAPGSGTLPKVGAKERTATDGGAASTSARFDAVVSGRSSASPGLRCPVLPLVSMPMLLPANGLGQTDHSS